MSCIILIILFYVNIISADIYTLPILTLHTGVPVIQRVAALYKTNEIPTLISDLNGEGSYINFDMKFTAVGHIPPAGSKIEVSVLQATTLDDLGYYDELEYSTSYCCTQELLNRAINNNIPGCNQQLLNQLIIKPSAQYQQSFFATFNGGSNIATMIPSGATYNVQSTGEHLMITSNCNPALTSDVEVTGTTTWHNTYGYLLGRLYNYLPFYIVLVTYYCVITLIWLLLLIKHRDYVVTVQYYITLLLVWSCIEHGINFLDYNQANIYGVRNIGVVYDAIILTGLRLTASRLLVVCVSLGYGSVRAELSKSTIAKLAVSGIIYCTSEVVLDYMTRESVLNNSNDQRAADQLRALVSIPVLVLNVIFYYWIFTSLQNTIQLLRDNSQYAKLRVYNLFLASLIISLLLSFGFAFWQTWFLATGQLGLHFSLVFLIDDGFFTIIYTLIISAIALLWKPSRDSKSYGYAEIGNDEQLDDYDKLELAEPSVTQRNNNSSYTPSSNNGNGYSTTHQTPQPHFTIDDEL